MVSSIDEVFSLPGALVVIDFENARAVEKRGLTDNDVAEVLVHFNDTWNGIGEMQLPVINDFTQEPWLPLRFWCYGGGQRVAIRRQDRYLIVDARSSEKFLAAAAGDGLVDGVGVWDAAESPA